MFSTAIINTFSIVSRAKRAVSDADVKTAQKGEKGFKSPFDA
jgi:hypothetical protein